MPSVRRRRPTTCWPRRPAKWPGHLVRERPGGRFNLGDITPEEAYPLDDAGGVLVLNTLPWARHLIVDEPGQRGGAAPVGMLDMFFPEGVPWGGEKPEIDPVTVQGEVPAWGYAYLREPCATTGELRGGAHWLENDAYRIEVDPAQGGLLHWLDKGSGRRSGRVVPRLAARPVRLRTGDVSDGGRTALFAPDFSAKDFGSWRDDAEFDYEGPSQVTVRDSENRRRPRRLGPGPSRPRDALSDVHIHFVAGRPRGWISSGSSTRSRVEDPESVFFAFPFSAQGSSFLGDFNGIPCEPDVEQLPGSVKSWYPVQGWVGVDGADHSVVLVPLDAPLVHLGGVNTGRVVEHLDQGTPVIMSWALNNHWFVNFKAQQDGRLRLRYSLTSMPGTWTSPGPCGFLPKSGHRRWCCETGGLSRRRAVRWPRCSKGPTSLSVRRCPRTVPEWSCVS